MSWLEGSRHQDVLSGCETADYSSVWFSGRSTDTVIWLPCHIQTAHGLLECGCVCTAFHSSDKKTVETPQSTLHRNKKQALFL